MYGVQQATKTMIIVIANLTVLIFDGDVADAGRSEFLFGRQRVVGVQVFDDDETTQMILT